MALGSNCVFRVCDGVLFFCSVLTRSAVSFLYTSRSGGWRHEMAVSVSRARFWIQFLGLFVSCILVLSVTRSFPVRRKLRQSCSPFCGKIFVRVGGRLVCCWVRRLSLLSTVWYLSVHSFWSFPSMWP